MVTFSILDYILFACTLGVSTLIGIYYAVKSCLQKRKKQDHAAEFLMGGRKMPLIPTAMSLLVSFVSGISMLSYPSEVYMMGTGFCWMIIGCMVGVLISGIFILPVVYPLPSMSIYAYLEERFNSHALRLYASISFQLTTLVYTSVVLYAPSIALSGITGMKLWMLLIIVGAVCTVYTSIGGLKAVVWTDTFQGKNPSQVWNGTVHRADVDRGNGEIRKRTPHRMCAYKNAFIDYMRHVKELIYAISYGTEAPHHEYIDKILEHS